MKLLRTSETFNLGDTSFRRKTLIDDYKTLLPFLKEINAECFDWNIESQSKFYEKVLEQTNLFTRNKDEDFAKRGRTLTNALVKLGLTDDKRRLSKVAINWLKNECLNPDLVEVVLGLDVNNLLFTRQLLKLRIYDANGMNYFYPFRVALELAKRYRNIPQMDFLTLIHLIQPSFTNERIENIISNYKYVSENTKSFASFLNENFPDENETSTPIELFKDNVLDRKKFDLLFVNRKSSTIQDIYYQFVILLLDFKKNKSSKTLNDLLKISSDTKIKKAFGFGKSIFVRSSTVKGFLKINKDNPLLDDNNENIYIQFVHSKKYDIVSEYCDMTKRTFNLSSLFDFKNGLVNAINKKMFTIIFDNMIYSGEEDFKEYEQNVTCPFFREYTLTDILGINEEKILSKIRKYLGISNQDDITNAVANQKEQKFRSFIKDEFPKEKIIELLQLFSKREDNKIKSLVSESATIPTIYEYIVAIAWFYISSEDFEITKSMNLTLDGNMRPLSHAVGGMGDIVIHYEDLTLMIEVTLMNKQAQKRSEWEPVLRHATNLTVDEYPKNVMTLFVADELDINTINIWRAIASVPLQSSNKNAVAELVKIFPLENKELIELLVNNRDEKELLESIDDSYNQFSSSFNFGWRDEILNSIIEGNVEKYLEDSL